jgi:hypothetical protein
MRGQRAGIKKNTEVTGNRETEEEKTGRYYGMKVWIRVKVPSKGAL